MDSFTKDEKCAMIVTLTHIACCNNSRSNERTAIMLRYQNMIGIDNFDMLEYSNTKIKDAIPTLQAMSNEKKKYYVQMMLGLIMGNGQINDDERKGFISLVSACRIPNDVVKVAIEETIGKNSNK